MRLSVVYRAEGVRGGEAEGRHWRVLGGGAVWLFHHLNLFLLL